jgi:hypothetical protein
MASPRRRHGRPRTAPRPRGGPLVAGSPVGPRADQREPGAGTPAGRQLGLDDRDIPGARTHLVNAESPGTRPKEGKAGELFDGMNAHGVPDTLAEPGYEVPSSHVGQAPRPAPEPSIADAVPVYMVETPGKRTVMRVTGMFNVLAPANTASLPARLCSEDPRRVEVRVLNEDPVNDVRVAMLEDLNDGGEGGGNSAGALISHCASSYTTIPTQGELFCHSINGTAVRVSVMLITEEDE